MTGGRVSFPARVFFPPTWIQSSLPLPRSLRGCTIGAEGAASFAEALKHNTTLKSLR